MRRLTSLLAEMPFYAGDKPGNYGSCVAYEAMGSNQPVSEFIAQTSPIAVFGNEGQSVINFGG